VVWVGEEKKGRGEEERKEGEGKKGREGKE